MECPWETAILHASGMSNPLESVTRLTELHDSLQNVVNNHPDRPIPFVPPPYHGQTQPAHANPPHPRRNNNARHGVFAGLAEDEGSGVDIQVPNGQNPADAPPARCSRWNADDVFVQVITTLGEALGKLALLCVKEKNWLEGAGHFERSCRLLNLALEYSDHAYARISARAEVGDNELIQVVDRVRNNCAAVSIAAGHGMDKKNQFEREAAKRQEKLRQNLEPQWSSRDNVKANIGEEKWTHNPHPKKDYARMREADEKELRGLETALILMTTVNYEQIHQKSENLRRTL